MPDANPLPCGAQVRAGVRNVDKANAIFSGKEAPSGVGYTGKQDKKPAPIDTSLVEAVKFDVTARLSPTLTEGVPSVARR